MNFHSGFVRAKAKRALPQRKFETFKIFKLPLVVTTIVLKFLSADDIFFLSLTSKKTKTIVKNLEPCHTSPIEISLDKSVEIKMGPTVFRVNPIPEMSYLLYLCELGLDTVLINRKLGQVDIYWEHDDTVPLISSVLANLAAIWKNPQVSFTSFHMYNDGLVLKVVKILNGLNIPLKRVRYWHNSATSKEYLSILQETKTVPKVIMDATLREKLSVCPQDFQQDILEVRDGHWMKLSHFLKCKSVKLEYTREFMHGFNFEQSLRSFFQFWMEAVEPKLEFLSVTFFKDVNFNSMVQGLNDNRDVTEHRLELQRSDGMKTEIVLAGRTLEMKVCKI